MQHVFRARSQAVDESRTHFPRAIARSSNSRMLRSRCVQRPVCEKSFQLQKLQNHEARSPSRRARPARKTHLVQLRRQLDRRSLFKHVRRHEKSIQGRRHRRVERRLHRWVHSVLLRSHARLGRIKSLQLVEKRYGSTGNNFCRSFRTYHQRYSVCGISKRVGNRQKQEHFVRLCRLKKY